jgi:prepilin-type processing-associated H-X9-DG protein
MKQLATGVMAYAQDYDETFPLGVYKSNWQSTWMVTIQPYLKNLGVAVCPSDSDGGITMPRPELNQGSWQGVGISYAINGYYSPNWCCAPDWNYGFPLVGVSGIPNEDSWLSKGKGAAAMADVNRPADSIMIAEKHNFDSKYVKLGWLAGNSSNFSPNAFIGGGSNGGGGVLGDDWGDHWLPDPTRSATALYPTGPNGAVSVHKNGMANFAFCDGHVKAMKPVQTNPGGAANNMWDTTRQ